MLSVAPDEFYDALAINAASASTQISGLPFYGPVAGVRLALIGDQWVAFPKFSQLADAVFDLTVAGRLVTDANGKEDVAIMMVEAEATETSWELIKAGATKPDEAIVAQGLEAAKPFLAVLAKAQSELAAQSAKPIADYPVFPPYSDEAYNAVAELAYDELRGIYQIADKTARQDADDALKERVKVAINEKVSNGELSGDIPPMVSAAYKSVTKKIVRGRILTDGVRIDGRGLTDIRALDAEVQVIPRVHGSAIFQRGETQILGVTTLNMLKMEQQIDSLAPIKKKRYLHHYNFPPYSTGETGRVGSPKRREIGHGFLAERALVPVLPSREEFPYAIRQVSEALSSNGSTSMGSVCASTLSLLNAGVPLRAPVAGIAMGLVSDEVDGETRYAALTDILGAEDALGDMDFKVAGTSEFVTAIQLDTKLAGLPSSVLDGALKQAKEARTAILAVLNAAIDGPDEMAPTAPRVISVQIPVDKIGELIGPKGKTINQIQDDTGADISIEDDGTVYIGAVDGESAEAARAAVNAIANPLNPEVGERFLGTVVKLATFGAFVSLTLVRTACCTSPRCASSPAASGSRTSRMCWAWVRRSRSRSPRSTTAESCRSLRCSMTPRVPRRSLPTRTARPPHPRAPRSPPRAPTRVVLRTADMGRPRRARPMLLHESYAGWMAALIEQFWLIGLVVIAVIAIVAIAGGIVRSRERAKDREPQYRRHS